MGFINQALTLDEQIEAAELLSQSGPRTLVFARGVFTAAAISPRPLDPTEWLPLVLGGEVPDSQTLKRLLTLLVRDANDVAAGLASGIAPTPESDDEDVVREFCRGFVQIAQKEPHWTGNQAAFDLTLPFMVLSGYVQTDSLKELHPEAAERPEEFLTQCRTRLGGGTLELFEFFREAREGGRRATQSSSREKIGRNDPCPCGSGKKHKKCCGAL